MTAGEGDGCEGRPWRQWNVEGNYGYCGGRWHYYGVRPRTALLPWRIVKKCNDPSFFLHPDNHFSSLSRSCRSGLSLASMHAFIVSTSLLLCCGDAICGSRNFARAWGDCPTTSSRLWFFKLAGGRDWSVFCWEFKKFCNWCCKHLHVKLYSLKHYFWVTGLSAFIRLGYFSWWIDFSYSNTD